MARTFSDLCASNACIPMVLTRVSFWLYLASIATAVTLDQTRFIDRRSYEHMGFVAGSTIGMLFLSATAWFKLDAKRDDKHELPECVQKAFILLSVFIASFTPYLTGSVFIGAMLGMKEIFKASGRSFEHSEEVTTYAVSGLLAFAAFIFSARSEYNKNYTHWFFPRENTARPNATQSSTIFCGSCRRGNANQANGVDSTGLLSNQA